MNNYLHDQRYRASGLIQDVIKASKEVSSFTSAYMDVIDSIKLDVVKFQDHQNSRSSNSYLAGRFTASKSTISLFESEVGMKLGSQTFFKDAFVHVLNIMMLSA